MKLYTAPTSPFGRKASIVAREHGIQLDEETTNPFESDQLARLNPMKLIPVLVLDDGAVLLESPLICEYLDSIGTGPTLFPEANRWLWRTRMMIGHGLADASVQLRLQQVLPAGEQSATLKTRYTERMARAVAALDSQTDALAEGGRIADAHDDRPRPGRRQRAASSATGATRWGTECDAKDALYRAHGARRGSA